MRVMVCTVRLTTTRVRGRPGEAFALELLEERTGSRGKHEILEIIVTQNLGTYQCRACKRFVFHNWVNLLIGASRSPGVHV
jgi:hypothetical protein